ncbi:hypothetical protein UP09_30660 [Bradyrhizobium sp. LTSP885]|uniref:hypothetical protein n=1 Tax=Bradyrhizobium sp. LTSP885 TaxID=1619232 RepID=UPI0005CA3EB0|nr:hypothetical protein [Bradyrhizobium sp. LTSP885]KJC35593.1 hypothetical protein UP09_30660 [Bradyrhizobium sp. LTSP885]
MQSFVLHDLPFLLLLASLAFAGIAWVQIGGWLKRAANLSLLFTLWLGFYIVQYLAGVTLSDYMLQTVGRGFCKLVAVERCATRQAEEEDRLQRQLKFYHDAAGQEAARQVQAELERRAKIEEADKLKAQVEKPAEKPIGEKAPTDPVG